MTGRRRVERTPIRIPAEVLFHRRNGAVATRAPVLVRDLSSEGACFTTRSIRFPRTLQLHGVCLRICDPRGRAVALRGRIVRLDLTGEPTFGIRFLDRDPALQGILRTAPAEPVPEGSSRSSLSGLAIVAHELRRPLTAILGWAGLLRESSLRGGKRLEAIEAIQSGARVMARRTEELLDLSTMALGRMKLTPGPIDPARVARLALLETYPLFAQKNIRVSLKLDSIASPCSGDAGRLGQAVGNLLSNAAKFTPKGGRVSIRLLRLRDGYEFRVRDSGCGVEPGRLPRVFSFFERPAAPCPESSGLGVGLALARAIVELHGGRAGAESPGPGRGSTFFLRLPFVPPPARD